MADMNRLECKITVRMPAEMDARMRRAMRRRGIVKSSDFVRQAVVRALADGPEKQCADHPSAPTASAV